MDVVKYHQKYRKSAFIFDSISNRENNLKNVERKRPDSIAIAEGCYIYYDNAFFATPVFVAKIKEDNETYYDNFETDGPQAIEKNIFLKPQSNTLKSIDSGCTLQSNFSSDDFNVEEQLAVETARSNFNSFAISTIKNCTVLFVGCALATIAAIIAINIYYKLEPRNESLEYASFDSTIDLKVSTDRPVIGKY